MYNPYRQSNSLVPGVDGGSHSMIAHGYPNNFYSHRGFPISPQGGNSAGHPSNSHHNYYPQQNLMATSNQQLGAAAANRAAAALYSSYNEMAGVANGAGGLFPPYTTTDPCKQALMMASQAAGFGGIGAHGPPNGHDYSHYG